MTRGENVEAKVDGATGEIGFRFVVISSNEIMLNGHKTTDGQKLHATQLSRRGKSTQTLDNDLTHELAVRKRLVELHVLEK